MATENTVESGEYLFYPSPNDEINQELLPFVDKLNSEGILVKMVSDGLILDGKMILPFLQTPQGDRYFGTAQIINYVERNSSN